jgi:ATP-binding cassette, subfamily B, bacterial MsbA
MLERLPGTDRLGNRACFDPALATSRTLILPIHAVIDLLLPTHAPDRIAEYREAMRRGERFPPIAVVRVAGRYLVADGHKRLSAYRSLPVTEIVVELWSFRRWLRDQRRQLSDKTRQQWRLLSRAPVDAVARRQAVRLFWDTVGHWRRCALSIARLVRPAPLSATARLGVSAMTPTHVFERLVRECLAFPGRLLAIFTSLVIVGAAQLCLTWLVKLWAETLVTGGAAALLPSLMFWAALISVGMVLAVFLSRYLLNNVNQRMMERQRTAVHQRLLGMGVVAVRELQNGEWMSRVFNDIGALSGFMRDILKRLVGEGIVLVGAIAMMFYLQWRLACAICVVVPVVALLLSRFGTVIRSRSLAAQQALGKLSAMLNEQLLGLTTIKDFRTEDFEHQHFAQTSAEYRREAVHSEWWTAMLMTVVWLITGTGLLVVVGYGSGQVLSGRLTPASLLAFCLYALQTVEPLRRLAEVQAMLQRALAAGGRVYELIDSPGVEQDGTGMLPDVVRGELRLEDVDFRYRADHAVLSGLSLHIVPGETVAIVAASGGGKSTLASLLVRFADPQRGRIVLDSIDLRTLRLAELRRAVCVVEQEPFIFSGPLIDNIRYGSWHAPRQVIDAAVTLAGLGPLVNALGLHGVVEERGRDLSGGQKQRIALARAIVRNPAVLVLDEATSALDSDTEAQIFAQLEQWLLQRTVIVMAHRLATISRFGRVVVLQRGGVVGDGSVAQLLHGCPEFRQLFAEQLSPLGPAETSHTAL